VGVASLSATTAGQFLLGEDSLQGQEKNKGPKIEAD
jgi:hypothetical protein